MHNSMDGSGTLENRPLMSCPKLVPTGIFSNTLKMPLDTIKYNLFGLYKLPSAGFEPSTIAITRGTV